MDKNQFCTRCGNCCKGMRWKKKFSFSKAISIAGGARSREDIEKALKTHYKKYLRRIGLPVEKMLPAEWNRKKKEILVQASVGRCRHLVFVSDKKAACLNYENRPKECRDYVCKKVREKMMLEKAKESRKEMETINASLGEPVPSF